MQFIASFSCSLLSVLDCEQLVFRRKVSAPRKIIIKFSKSPHLELRDNRESVVAGVSGSAPTREPRNSFQLLWLRQEALHLPRFDPGNDDLFPSQTQSVSRPPP